MGTMQKKMMKNYENGQLSCGIYSSPAAARSPLQGWVGGRSIKDVIAFFGSPILRRKLSSLATTY